MPDPIGFQSSAGGFGLPDFAAGVTHVVPHRGLARLLAFAGRNIDEVVNCRVAKRQIAHYFKLEREIVRRAQVLELEGQWNPLGRPA